MGKGVKKLSCIVEIQDNLMPSFLFNFLLKNFCQGWLGAKLADLKFYFLFSFLFFLFFFTLSFQAGLLMSRGMAI